MSVIVSPPSKNNHFQTDPFNLHSGLTGIGSDTVMRHHSFSGTESIQSRLHSSSQKGNQSPAAGYLSKSAHLSRSTPVFKTAFTEQSVDKPQAQGPLVKSFAPARFPNASLETFQTIPLSSRSPSPFEGFSSVARSNNDEIDNSILHQDPLDKEPMQSSSTVSIRPSNFRRWLEKLHLRGVPCSEAASEHKALLSPNTSRFDFPEHRKSDSSGGLITAVRTATMTIADTSIAHRSWIATRLSRLRRSGHVSNDSVGSGQIVDEAAWSRAIQRRRILEELVESEESYVADLKVYFTLLATTTSLSFQARSLVRENLLEILDLHESLLGELHKAIPSSEYSYAHASDAPVYHPKGHIRWHSADSGVNIAKFRDLPLARRLRHSIDTARVPKQAVTASAADTKTVIDVVRIFEAFIPYFFAYEEFGAKYELVVRDVASKCRHTSTEQTFERGVETLSRALESIKNQVENSHKGLTFADLIIKPIQRVCKYPLLFSDLIKYTPISDDPQAHTDAEKILFRLKETAKEINRSTDDPSTKELIGKTWLLQDRLKLNDQIALSTKELRLFGHVILCGALFVVYQSRAGIKGSYMLCTLFKSTLLLAIPEKNNSKFEVVATIPAVNISIENADNDRELSGYSGLQCHTAPFSWKIVFQAQFRLFEIMMVACSPQEESQWVKQINERSCVESLDLSSNSAIVQDAFSSLALDLKPLGTLYGQPNTLARRISIHRAATMTEKTHMTQVIIKHTESSDYSRQVSSNSSLSLARSKSAASAAHIKVLAPKRSTRMNLEYAMSDIWTKELLPYPGMRAEHPLKASAHHVMRKLSISSLASTFSWRSSTSDAVVPLPNLEDRTILPPQPQKLHRVSPDTKRARSSMKILSENEPPHQKQINNENTISFHRNPTKFLPPDFELKDSRLAKPHIKRLTVRAVSNDGISIGAKIGKIPNEASQGSSSKTAPIEHQTSNSTSTSGFQADVSLRAPSANLQKQRSVDLGKFTRPLKHQLRRMMD